jgi:hypothetical protein
MKEHKWHKEIKAWANGAKVQSKYVEEAEWVDEDLTTPDWNDFELKFRIKPQPKEPQYYYVWQNHKGEIRLFGDGLNELPIEYKYIGKIKLEDSE